LNEEYVLSERHASDMEVTLKSDEYFVMGDNRGASYDSRSWGPLQKGYITGMVRLRLWPVDRVMAFSTPTY
jgi:signal peptidase I